VTLPEDVVIIKLGLYTLACHELLNRLRDLQTATRADLRLGYEECLQRFDEELHRFFRRSSAKDRRQAAEQLGNLLYAQASLFRDSNERAAMIFDDVMAAIQGKAASWDCKADLEQLHAQGCDLARRFFAESPWPETQGRLGCECHAIIEHGAPADDDRIAMLAEPFGYRAAPMAYYSSYWDDEHEQYRTDVLLVRFTFDHNFALYLAYPFLFLHEYTAHVYATDHGNERFNDGWMLHAAAAFLKREWNKAPEQLGLSLEQADVFYERLYHTLNPIPHHACKFARLFDDWLSSQLPERFAQITYELAAFQPKPGEKPYWPNQLINALEHEFMTDRKRLLGKIRASADVRELMTTLSPV